MGSPGPIDMEEYGTSEPAEETPAIVKGEAVVVPTAAVEPVRTPATGQTAAATAIKPAPT